MLDNLQVPGDEGVATTLFCRDLMSSFKGNGGCFGCTYIRLRDWRSTFSFQNFVNWINRPFLQLQVVTAIQHRLQICARLNRRVGARPDSQQCA